MWRLTDGVGALCKLKHEMMLLIQISYHNGCFFWKKVDKSKISLGLKYAGTQEKRLLLPQVQSITNVYCVLNIFLSQLAMEKAQRERFVSKLQGSYVDAIEVRIISLQNSAFEIEH